MVEKIESPGVKGKMVKHRRAAMEKETRNQKVRIIE